MYEKFKPEFSCIRKFRFNLMRCLKTFPYHIFVFLFKTLLAHLPIHIPNVYISWWNQPEAQKKPWSALSKKIILEIYIYIYKYYVYWYWHLIDIDLVSVSFQFMFKCCYASLLQHGLYFMDLRFRNIVYFEIHYTFKQILFGLYYELMNWYFTTS
jgi:hypothetical protein